MNRFLRILVTAFAGDLLVVLAQLVWSLLHYPFSFISMVAFVVLLTGKYMFFAGVYTLLYDCFFRVICGKSGFGYQYLIYAVTFGVSAVAMSLLLTPITPEVITDLISREWQVDIGTVKLFAILIIPVYYFMNRSRIQKPPLPS